MKYVVILGDGMADWPLAELGNKTPLEVAKIPDINKLATAGQTGLIKTVPDNYKPGSDVANLSVMGYAPEKYYTGRSPLEALSMGIKMDENDVAVRCNLVTILDGKMIDYSSGEIRTPEAQEIIKTVSYKLGSDKFVFYPGVSYRHCLIVKNDRNVCNSIFTPPHDITGQPIENYMPDGYMKDEFTRLINESRQIVGEHPLSKARFNRDEIPPTNIWLWGAGLKPSLDSFQECYGLRGTVISAVDLLKGIAIGASMRAPDVRGATGTLATDIVEKVRVVKESLKYHSDYVYLHIEAPDECGHQGAVKAKILAIEMVNYAAKEIYKYLSKGSEPFVIAILSDHATPIATRTHSSEPVPYTIYKSASPANSGLKHTEADAKKGVYLPTGQDLIKTMLGWNV
ncbi:MAG: cofactor-independent phosphoglycerate mutase [Christensenellaceae bacterium]|jgi:2,3-bisphosphoglycerate-independent phosphoglycerate mutase|nr:cofactor-independent phosphoglycerate mutase [Christensenellaceae bacterium]